MAMIQAVHTTTIYWLVAVSVLTSIVASYAAFSFTERLSAAKGMSYVLWLMSGSLAMGLGIWSMHYLGMLAVRLPVEVVYHVPTVALSLMFAVLASLVVLTLVSRARLGPMQVAVGSVLMGSGIGAMHYTGMHAMRSSLMHHYSPAIVTLSVLVAVAFSWMALWIAFSLRTSRQREMVRLGGATLMGLGIAAMHYTAMAAVTFLPDNMSFSTAHTIRISTVGVTAVAVTTALVLFGSLLTAGADRKMYEQLAEHSDRLQAMAESSMDGIYLCESMRGKDGEISDFRVTYVNSNVEKTTQIPRNMMIGGRLTEFMPMVRRMGHLQLYRQVVVTGEPLAIEFPVAVPGQKTVWIRIQAVKLRDGLAITAADITARKEDEDQILRMAHYDQLTGLLNRSLLAERVEQGITRAQRSGRLMGIFLIDLDGFKQINDTRGHNAGDEVLVTVAGRLKAAVRGVDSVIRLGGDEFLIVTPDMKELANIKDLAGRIMDSFQSRIKVCGEFTEVHFSMGISIYPLSGSEFVELVAMADTAMYAAKRAGKNQFRIYEAPAAATAAQVPMEAPAGELLPEAQPR